MKDKVDDAVWAALFHARPQRSGMERVRLVRHESAARQGMIQNPAGEAKSVVLTEEGVASFPRAVRQDNLMCSSAVSQRKPFRFEVTARHMSLILAHRKSWQC
jgi:hypothetical protein